MRFFWLGGFAAAVAASTAAADPVVSVPDVFCFRITDIERISGIDGTDGNDFVFEFEVLNWTDKPAGGVKIVSNIGTSGRGGSPVVGASPTIAGIGIDRDGRGGAVGGTDIDASGLGLQTGQGTFDPVAIQSGRGRGDIAGHLNDWTPESFNAREALWLQDTGTAVPNVDLIAAPNLPAAEALVPGVPPVLDALGDTAVDGGPTPYTAGPGAGQPVPDGSGNVLDGFTLTMTDWDVGEYFSFNWNLLDENGFEIGVRGSGNPMGFGVVNMVRLVAGGALPPPLFPGLGNTGFQNQGSLSFFDTVWQVPNPTDFAVEFGPSVLAPVPLPPAGALLAGTLLAFARPFRRRLTSHKA